LETPLHTWNHCEQGEGALVISFLETTTLFGKTVPLALRRWSAYAGNRIAKYLLV
jgi:hypothetical protein